VKTFLVLSSLALGACSMTPSAAQNMDVPSYSTGKADGPATPAPTMPDSIHWVRNSAEYRAASLQAYRLAYQRLALKVSQKPPGTWAVVVDGDETVLNNSEYQKERAALGQGFSPDSWNEWVHRKAATAVPGAVAFANRVFALGGYLAVVTNRTDAQCDDTRANLDQLAFGYDVVLCMTDKSDKNPRFQQVASGGAGAIPAVSIEMYLGDQVTDFPALNEDLRLGTDDDFDDFGKDLIIIPNPMYGGWTANSRD
jgi:5'-nucleotidase (lipoprotein e(P4) family)